jgi:hypothetical protein
MSCTAAVDSVCSNNIRSGTKLGCQLYLKEGPELTINVLKQQWKKENNKGTFRMKFLKLFLAYFSFSTGVKAQTEKR